MRRAAKLASIASFACGLLVMASTVSGCTASVDEDGASETGEASEALGTLDDDTTALDEEAPEANSEAIGDVTCANDSDDSSCTVRHDDETVVEGDIVVPKKTASGSTSTKAIGVGGLETQGVDLDVEGTLSPDSFAMSGTTLWTNRKIPYVVTKGAFTAKGLKRIKAIMAEYKKKLGFHFVARTTQKDYVKFTISKDKRACYSNVGRIGGMQKVQLDPNVSGCGVHEVGHAMGLLHEQSRPDRDKYIRVHFENVIKGYKYAFDKSDGVKERGYDINSVMHYSSSAFSKNGRPTITRPDGSTKGLGYKVHLSTGDVQSLNALYRGQ